MADEPQSEYVEEELDAGEATEDVTLPEALEEGEEEMSDLFSKIGSSSEDVEQKARYLEYLQLIKEIEAQNNTIAEIKARIMDLCAKPCKTCSEEKEIRDLRACMEQENLKMQCLMAKAIQLQNFGSHRHWRDLPMATTFDEDNLAPYVYCSSPPRYSKPEKSDESVDFPCLCAEFFKKKSKTKSPCQPEPQPDCEENRHLNTVIRALKKMKITCPSDKKLVEEIAQVLCAQRKPCPPPCQQPCPRPCPPPCPRPCSPPCSPPSPPPCQQPCPQPCSSPCPPPCKSTTRHNKSMSFTDDSQDDEVLVHLKEKICCMQSAVNKLKREICKRERKRQQPVEDSGEPCNAEPDPLMDCGGKRTTKAEQIEKLKESYCHLLKEFSKKETQLCQLKRK